MHLKNGYISVIYKRAFILICVLGLYLNSGLPQGTIRWSVLSYYTILSNIICLLFFIGSFTAGIRHLGHSRDTFTFFPRLKGAVVFCITVTWLIYNFILAPTLFSMGKADSIYSAANIIVHYIVPVMVIADWLLFDDKANYRWYDPLLWLAIPYAYFIFTLLRARYFGEIPGTGSRYPYAFIDVDKAGIGQVVKNIISLTFYFLPLGYFYYLIDRLMGKNRRAVYG